MQCVVARSKLHDARHKHVVGRQCSGIDIYQPGGRRKLKWACLCPNWFGNVKYQLPHRPLRPTCSDKHGGAVTNEHGGSVTNEHGGSVTNEHGGSGTNEHKGTNEHGGAVTNEHKGTNEHGGSGTNEHSDSSDEYSDRDSGYTGCGNEHGSRSDEYGDSSDKHSGCGNGYGNSSDEHGDSSNEHSDCCDGYGGRSDEYCDRSNEYGGRDANPADRTITGYRRSKPSCSLDCLAGCFGRQRAGARPEPSITPPHGIRAQFVRPSELRLMTRSDGNGTPLRHRDTEAGGHAHACGRRRLGGNLRVVEAAHRASTR